MEPNPAFPIHRWPYDPSWELDGFDFSFLPVAHYRTAVKTFYNRQFTTDVSYARKPARPSEADYCRIVANNVAVQFRAMLYCREYYSSDTFWQRVRKCSVGVAAQGDKTEDLFVKARKAYLQSTGGCPNEAARLVDEWITFLETPPVATGSVVQPSASNPWYIRLRDWNAMRQGGGLINASERFTQPVVATGHASLPQTGGQYHMAGAPFANFASGYLPADIPIKQEDVSDDPSAMNLVLFEPGRPDPKGKRKRNQRSATPSPRLSKRHANGVYGDGGEDGYQQQLPMPEPLPGAFQEAHPNEFALVAPAEHESSSAVEDELALARLENGSGHRSTKARVTACEEKLAKHLNLIHGHDSKLLAQEELVAGHATGIKDLNSRVKSIEENPSANNGCKTMEESVVDLMARLSNKQEQSRIDTRFDSFGKDLAAEKVRGDNFDKAVTKQKRLMKKRLEAQNLHADQIEELSNRVAKLEGKFSGDKKSSDLKDEDAANTTTPLAQDQLANLTGRITQLEKRMEAQNKQRQSSTDKILNRLNALETDYSDLKKATDRHTAFVQRVGEQRVGEQGNQPSIQEQLTGALRNVVPGVRAQVQSLPARPPQAAYNHGYHQSQRHQYHPHGSR